MPRSSLFKGSQSCTPNDGVASICVKRHTRVQAAIADRGRSPLNHRRPQPRQTNWRIQRPLSRSTPVSSLSGPWHFQQRMMNCCLSIESIIGWCTPNGEGSRRVKSMVQGKPLGNMTPNSGETPLAHKSDLEPLPPWLTILLNYRP